MPRTRLLSLIAAGLLLGACGSGSEPAMRMIVIGIDGMDHGVARGLIDSGRMPNFARLESQGSFTPLETAIPPQSPVAWSNVTTGMDSGGHGIFDFLTRDPETYLPESSMVHVDSGGLTLKVGSHQLPLSGGSVELTRRGRPFWEVLENHGIESSIFRMPVNFPPVGKATRELSGMGTTDLRGTSGEFSFFTTRQFAFRGREIDGGHAYVVEVIDDIVDAELEGPENPFLIPGADGTSPRATSPFTVYVDPVDPVVKLVVGDEERVLEVGDWSEWLPVEFDLFPTQSLSGMARFYLQSVRPDFELYVTPVDFDPMAPAAPISHPDDFAAELAEATGRFYTEEMPEDTKAQQAGVFDYDEFLTQAKMAGDEVIAQYRYTLDHFNNGFLFYYFGNLDQVSHMMWHTRDPGHPAYDAARDARYANVIDDLYIQFDSLIGETLDRIDDDTEVLVMSDHGFGSFRQTFDVNAWLKENGYLAVISEDITEDPGLFANVDMAKTRAYNVGLNALYINVQGREAKGTVPPGERAALVDEIGAKLLSTINPKTGQPAVTRVYKRDEVYSDGGARELGPDIIIGFAEGIRASGDSAIGAVGKVVFADNTEDWSGDHEWDHTTVPGVFFASRPLKAVPARLQDVAATILAEFGIDEPVQPQD